MKILLIDGNSVLFRGFYATCYGNIMKTSFGVYTNAIYAFANMMEKAINIIKPDYCMVAFDKGKHTFRHEISADYKGGRKPAPEELVPQFGLVREMLDAYNIKFLELDDIEADDLIGSMAKKYDIETCIFSSDHDLLQLIDKTTSVYLMKKGMTDIQKLDEAELYKEYSLKPYQIIDFKGLAGDTSDNIKGVEGVGEKTATKLLGDYDTCEGIYEHISEIKGKLQEKLIRDKESCFTSKKLATIKTDVEIKENLDFFKLNIDQDGRNDFFKKYEMFSLIRETSKNNAIKDVDIKVNKISKEMLNNPYIHFVSDEFSYYNRNLRGLCFCVEDKCQYISLEDLKNDKETLEFLKSDELKAVYDYKAVLHCSFDNGFEIGKCHDVFLMSFLCNNLNNDLSLICRYYGLQLNFDLKDIYGSEKKPLIIDLTKEMNYLYNVSTNLYKVYNKSKKELKDKDIEYLYENVELPLSKVLFEMEAEGICCDKKELEKIALKTKSILVNLEKEIYEYAGEEINVNSPKQLAVLLYEKLDLPNLKKGSTNADVLEKLKSYHPIVSKILDYRKYTKLYSSYAEGLQKFIVDGKIHTIFSQTIVQTGRLSSYDPNLQNISVRDEESKEIRKAFKPSNGNVLMSSDYSQIELRVLASLANETKMIDAFKEGIDIHTKTAMDVFKLQKEEVSDMVRRQAKAVNFGVVYGISDFGLANQTNMSFGKAKQFIDDYFETYPNIKKYLDDQIAFCEANGYVKTILNRRRYINEIKDKNYMVREFGKRAAMNSTIQGSAADIIKLAMLSVSKALKDNNLKSKLLLQVHDELIFDVPKDEIEIMQKVISSAMSNAYKLNVKLDASMAIGDTWLEAK